MRYTDDHVRAKLLEQLGAKSMRAVASEIGVSANFIHAVAHSRALPGPKIAKHFGFTADGKMWVRQ